MIGGWGKKEECRRNITYVWAGIFRRKRQKNLSENCGGEEDE